MDDHFIRERITYLLATRNLSERKLSLAMGHSPSYIHSIVSGKALPSMHEFLYLCELFDISPKEFFETGEADPSYLNEIVTDLKRLDAKKLEHLRWIIKDML